MPKLPKATGICPRCGEKKLQEEQVLNSVSRRDNSTRICSSCGADEAMYDFAMAKAGGRLSPFERDMTALHERAWLDLGKPFSEIDGKPYVPLMMRKAS